MIDFTRLDYTLKEVEQAVKKGIVNCTKLYNKHQSEYMKNALEELTTYKKCGYSGPFPPSLRIGPPKARRTAEINLPIRDLMLEDKSTHHDLIYNCALRLLKHKNPGPVETNANWAFVERELTEVLQLFGNLIEDQALHLVCTEKQPFTIYSTTMKNQVMAVVEVLHEGKVDDLSSAAYREEAVQVIEDEQRNGCDESIPSARGVVERDPTILVPNPSTTYPSPVHNKMDARKHALTCAVSSGPNDWPEETTASVIYIEYGLNSPAPVDLRITNLNSKSRRRTDVSLRSYNEWDGSYNIAPKVGGMRQKILETVVNSSLLLSVCSVASAANMCHNKHWKHSKWKIEIFCQHTDQQQLG